MGMLTLELLFRSLKPKFEMALMHLLQFELLLP